MIAVPSDPVPPVIRIVLPWNCGSGVMAASNIEGVVRSTRARMPPSQRFEIGGRAVGGGAPTYVIAEAGANHNRDIDVARRLIDVALEAGADAVKFQTYSGDRIYSRKTPRFKYLEPLTDKTPAELLEEISLPREWQAPLADYARERGIDFFSS